MPEPIRLLLPPRPGDLFKMLSGLAGRLGGSLPAWRRRIHTASESHLLRSMSDRELADLAIGRGELTRER